MSFVRQHLVAIVNISLGVGLIFLGSLGVAAYDWLWVNSGRSACIPHAVWLFEISFGVFGGLFLLLLVGGFVGKWADNRTGWGYWSTISVATAGLIYVVFLAQLTPAGK